MPTAAYRENHYVAQWYQRRFLPVVGEKKFHYLDLKPDQFRDPKGALRQKKALNRWGTDRCFKETDLYTSFWCLGVHRNRAILFWSDRH
jgi:hypothetical protein